MVDLLFTNIPAVLAIGAGAAVALALFLKDRISLRGLRVELVKAVVLAVGDPDTRQDPPVYMQIGDVSVPHYSSSTVYYTRFQALLSKEIFSEELVYEYRVGAELDAYKVSDDEAYYYTSESPKSGGNLSDSVLVALLLGTATGVAVFLISSIIIN